MTINYRFALMGAMAICCSMFSPAQAETAEGAQAEAYLPLFVLYSGASAPEQLQALRGFLDSNQLPGEVVQDTLDTVAYKLRTFKAGFAYPVFRNDTSKARACVVGDNRHAEPTAARSLLASERVRLPLGLQDTPSLSEEQLLDQVFAHELFHCYDMGRHSLEGLGQQVVQKGQPYFAYWGEVGADIYAALLHLQQRGERSLLRVVRDFRTLNALNGDAVHYTAQAIDYVLEHHSEQSLKGLNTHQLIALADAIREEVALSERDYAALEAATAHLSADYDELISTYPGLAKAHNGPLMQPVAGAVPFGQVVDLYLHVRAALWRLGGRDSLESRYFSPLAESYDRMQERPSLLAMRPN